MPCQSLEIKSKQVLIQRKANRFGWSKPDTLQFQAACTPLICSSLNSPFPDMLASYAALRQHSTQNPAPALLAQCSSHLPLPQEAGLHP